MINNKIIITGASSGIGRATALLFLSRGYFVYGIDKLEKTITDKNYIHYQQDLCNLETPLPDIIDADILFNNAGSQNTSDDITNNLKTVIRVTEQYIKTNNLKSILFNASASAHNGFEFPEYSASKAGMIGYMKNVAWRVAPKTTCNSISCGGVLTSLNDCVINDAESWQQIMKVTPMKKWATAEEIAEWVYFLTVINKSCSGQDVLIDNGEKDLNCTFVWKDFNNE